MDWIHAPVHAIIGWLQFLHTHPEILFLGMTAVLLGLSLPIGWTFATDHEEPAAIRITGSLIVLCCIGVACVALGLLVS